MRRSFPPMVLARIALLAVFLGATFCLADDTAPTPEAMRSPVNQVFQFMQSGECNAWSDHSTTKATAYLWIPENCKKLRGLLILCTNVPEHMLVGNPAIRQACTDNDLGIVWCVPSFFNFKLKSETQTDVAFLQQLLNGLAKTSGYDEVATVPWLPMGESGHLLMVDALVEQQPERCIAGIWIKNCHLPPRNRVTPALVVYGSAQEWSQDKTDIRTHWNDIGKNYDGILQERKSHPDWPLSFTIDGWSGHFDCSERIVHLFARYIDLVTKARLSTDGSPNLRPIDLDKGCLADIPVPGHENAPVTLCAATPAASRGVPWFFDQAFAEEAQSIARINWSAQSQLPAFETETGEMFPFSFQGITSITLNKKPAPLPDGTIPPMLESEPDGITFRLKGALLDKIPAGFVGAGDPLAQAPGPCTLEWLSGCVEPLGDGQFRIALDRTWPSPIYIAVRHPGTNSIRGVVQPAGINRDGNSDGMAQKITFDPLANVTAGTQSLALSARSDSGLLVRYFVVAGPAIIHDSKLVFTPIPPRTAFPVSVTVAAWQWGRYTEPKIKKADIIRQTFEILAP